MAVNIDVTFPSMPSQEFIDDDKIVTEIWGRFLHDLWLRTGGVFDDVHANGGSVDFDLGCVSSVAVGDAVYVKGDGDVDKADATAIATAKVFGLIVSKARPNACTVRTSGLVTGLSGISAGSQHFLSTTPGDVSAGVPSATGNVVTGLGKGLTATSLFVELSNDFFIRS